MDEETAQPGLEAGRVAQGGQAPPGRDQGALQGVLGQVGVAQDPRGDRIHPVTGQDDQVRECLAIAVPGPLDELVHRHSLGEPHRMARSPPMSVAAAQTFRRRSRPRGSAPAGQTSGGDRQERPAGDQDAGDDHDPADDLAEADRLGQEDRREDDGERRNEELVARRSGSAR